MSQVTVILPVHNGANYLRSSIESVLAQDCDFELHVLDDGSTDESPQIAQSTGDNRVRYSKNPGRCGLFKTLNRGFSEAQTSLVRIWAHDDLMLPGSLKRFVQFADEHPSAGMLYCDFFAVDSGGRRTGRETVFASQRQRTPELADAIRSAALFLSFGCLPGNISTVLLRKDAWQKVGGFLEGIQQAPDYDMWLRVSEFFDVGFIREKLIELRDHPLQLGKLGQKQMTTIFEELAIFSDLQRRLGGVLGREQILRHWRHNRGRQHVHWIAKAFARGDLNVAGRGWRAMRLYGQPWRQVVFWLFSVNGRFGAMNGADFYDRILFSAPSKPL